MTTHSDDVRVAFLVAARAFLTDAMDEAHGISMQAEEAEDALGGNAVLQALGILSDYARRISVLKTASEGAFALLLRARDGGGR